MANKKVMTVKQFLAGLQLALDSPSQYATGAFGAPTGVKNNTERYANNSSAKVAKKIRACPDGTFMFDCNHLGLAQLWGWCADPTKVYGGANYKANGVPDISVKSIHKYCDDWKDDGCPADAMLPGEWMRTKDNTHIGYYIGNGEVIECTQKWDCKVQRTKLTDREWRGHGRFIYIDYGSELYGREKGDVNGDGEIDARDVLLCKKIVLKTYEPTPAEEWAADINGDGEVSILDYLRLKKIVLKG